MQRVTNGQGIDIVLNSLSHDFIPASLRVLLVGRPFHRDWEEGYLERQEVARQFPGVEYHALYLGEIAAAQPDIVRGMLRKFFRSS